MWCSRGKYLPLACLLSLMALMPCRAQYHPLYSQYMFNGLAINPAYAGSQDVLSLAALCRMQWMDYDGAPTTQTLTGDFHLLNPKVSLGLLAYNDMIGIYRRTGAFAVYAFRFKLGPGRLSFGLQAGAEQMRSDESKIKTIDPGDPMFSYAVNKSFMPNAGFGSYYYTSRYFIGLSVPTLFEYRPSSADTYKGKLAFNDVMLYGGGLVPFSTSFKLKPSILLHYTQKELICDLNCNVILFPKEILEVGVSYRNASTLVAMAEYQINSQFSVGYAYDYSFGKLNITSGSHELMLRYIFRYRVNTESPLYLK